MSHAIYFEDFEIGATREYGEYAVTKEEIIEFARKYDPQPFHLSEEAGKAMHFGGLCASGWHTCAMVMRLVVDGMEKSESASLGSPGVDELRWKKPVYPGDVLRVESTVVEKRESRSRQDMGTLFLENKVYNQNDELVMSFKPIVMYKRRPAK
jgi:acyl dehydratase